MIPREPHVLLCYKNFSKDCNASHIGLGVTAGYTAKTLNGAGIFAEARPIFGADDLALFIQGQESGPRPVTHVVLMAQWIPVPTISLLLVRAFPHIHFAQNCHSNVGFLQAEPPAIDFLRAAIRLEMTVPNFVAASNSFRLCESLQQMYRSPVTYLPNLYYLHGKEPVNRPLWNGGTLRIGCFGSLRIYKNFSTAIAAGIELTTQLKCHSEIWINSGRTDGAGNVVYRTALAWTKGLSNVTLKELPWASWPEFRHIVSGMNVLMQPSYTETFNNVTADGIAEGTPSVVGPSIEWVPHNWIAEPDDASSVAQVARNLLFDPYAAHNGYQALKAYVERGLPFWKKWIRS
jgi:hypothetical protein